MMCMAHVLSTLIKMTTCYQLLHDYSIFTVKSKNVYNGKHTSLY